MNESAKYNFDDEEEGYVITFKLGFENNLDEDVFYNASTMMLSDDGTENLYMKSGLVDRDDWLKGDNENRWTSIRSWKIYWDAILHNDEGTV